MRKEEGWEPCGHKLRSARSCLELNGAGGLCPEPPKKAWPCWPLEFCPGMLILDFWPPRLLNAEMIPTSLPTGEGNGKPLQYSCLENPMDGGAW